jgi:hypothetical protein
MNGKRLTKCDFCRYWTGSSCRVVPNSQYCKEALDEYYQHVRGVAPKTPVKSFRSWDRKR